MTSAQKSTTLPPELYRDILTHFYDIATVHSWLTLRLVNKLFDSEIVTIVEIRHLFRQRHEKMLFPGNSESEFMATYMMRRPHRQSPRHANMSSFLNTLLDEALSLGDFSTAAPERRSYMLLLCMSARREYWNQYTMPMLADLDFWSSLDPDYQLGPDAEGSTAIDHYERQLLITKTLTGVLKFESKSSRAEVDAAIASEADFRQKLLGSVVRAAVLGRQYSMLQYIFERHITDRYDDYSLSHDARGALELAIMIDDLPAVRIVMESHWAEPLRDRAFCPSLYTRMLRKYEHEIITEYFESLFQRTDRKKLEAAAFRE